MSFNATENSNYGGEPILLYEFLRTSGGTDYYWRYCTADQDIDYSGATYKAVAISDGGIRESGEAAGSDYVVTMPVVEDLPDMFRNLGSTPSDVVFLTVRRLHFDDLTEARVIWVGTLAGITQTDEVQVKITCNTLVASFKRGGLRLSYTRGCPHALYDPQCTMDPNDFIVAGTVLSIIGNRIDVDGFEFVLDEFFGGGYTEWTMPSGLVERRAIISNTEGIIDIMGVATGLEVGATIYGFPGCLRTTDDCQNKFNNLPNYGGFPQTPGKSPFSNDPVF